MRTPYASAAARDHRSALIAASQAWEEMHDARLALGSDSLAYRTARRTLLELWKEARDVSRRTQGFLGSVPRAREVEDRDMVIVTRWRQGATIAEIAAETATSTGNIGSRIHRMRRSGVNLPMRKPRHERMP